MYHFSDKEIMGHSMGHVKLQKLHSILNKWPDKNLHPYKGQRNNLIPPIQREYWNSTVQIPVQYVPQRDSVLPF